MKISVKWLKDYVALPADVDELARRLTAVGLEIEGMDRPGDALRGVVVARIAASVQHPNADKLSVTQIDLGQADMLQVVCGAKNFKVGDKVPLATLGTRLPNGVEIKQAPLRGVDSFGMLCSAKELGLSEESSGLLILPADLAPGTPIAEALGLGPEGAADPGTAEGSVHRSGTADAAGPDDGADPGRGHHVDSSAPEEEPR